MSLHRRLVWKVAKGFRGRANNCIKIARQQAEKALQHAYRGRKEKKRDARALWITRINAGAREHGVKYSQLQAGLRDLNVSLNRKMLAELAANEPFSFRALVQQVAFMRGVSADGSGGGGGSMSNSAQASGSGGSGSSIA